MSTRTLKNTFGEPIQRARGSNPGVGKRPKMSASLGELEAESQERQGMERGTEEEGKKLKTRQGMASTFPWKNAEQKGGK